MVEHCEYYNIEIGGWGRGAGMLVVKIVAELIPTTDQREHFFF